MLIHSSDIAEILLENDYKEEEIQLFIETYFPKNDETHVINILIPLVKESIDRLTRPQLLETRVPFLLSDEYCEEIIGIGLADNMKDAISILEKQKFNKQYMMKEITPEEYNDLIQSEAYKNWHIFGY